MKKSGMKRTLSMVLVLVMMISLLPATALTASAAAVAPVVIDFTKATIDGLVSTSKIITSAALIMIVITGAFAFTEVMPVKQIGVGIAIAIAIDATIIRLMLVPSFMKLFGDWNWWLPFKKGRN